MVGARRQDKEDEKDDKEIGQGWSRGNLLIVRAEMGAKVDDGCPVGAR